MGAITAVPSAGTVFSIALSAAFRTAGWKRMPIAMLGVRYKGAQKIEITRPMLAMVVANFRKRDTGEVPIDYDHALETAAGLGDAVPAAGWIKAMDDAPDGQGILWGAVQWTPRAAGMIQAGEYKYISPVIDPSVRDNKTGEPQGWTLTSAALTNLPVLQGMPALVLSEHGWQEIAADEVFRAQRAVGEAIRAGKILPGQRAAIEKMALSNPASCRSLVESLMCSLGSGEETRGDGTVRKDNAMGYVDQDWDSVQLEITRRANRLMADNRQLDYATAEEAVHREDPSLAVKDWDAIQVELTRRVKQMMAGNNQLTYRAALEGVLRADPNLSRRYRAARMRWLGGPDAKPQGDSSQSVDIEIQPLVEGRIAASDGRMSSHDAFLRVMAERPDLARRKKASMR